MIEHVAAAIKQRNYAQAHHLLQPLLKEQPHNPWVQLYAGQLHELSNRPDSARAVYQRLLQATPNRQVLGQARRGLERLTASALPPPQAQSSSKLPTGRQAKSAPPVTPPPVTPPPITTAAEAILVLQPAYDRDRAVKAFAQLMAIDRYTAQIQLPRRGWRFHSTGTLASLLRHGQQLQQAGIPVQVLSLQAMRDIHVFRVKTFQQLRSPAVLCESAAGQLGNLAFTWQDVAQCVEGRLPIFEDVVDVDSRKRLMRKEKTQDYAYVFDLHLPKRRAILRLCDQTYRFEPKLRRGFDASQGEDAPQLGLGLTRQHQWQTTLQQLMQRIDSPVWADFVPFGESALDAMDMLPGFPTHIDILRKRETPWDRAFHIYSSTVFDQSRASQP